MPNAQPNLCTLQLSDELAQEQQNNNNTYETNSILRAVVNALGEYNDSAASGDASTEITLAVLLRPDTCLTLLFYMCSSVFWQRQRCQRLFCLRTDHESAKVADSNSPRPVSRLYEYVV